MTRAPCHGESPCERPLPAIVPGRLGEPPHVPRTSAARGRRRSRRGPRVSAGCAAGSCAGIPRSNGAGRGRSLRRNPPADRVAGGLCRVRRAPALDEHVRRGRSRKHDRVGALEPGAATLDREEVALEDPAVAGDRGREVTPSSTGDARVQFGFQNTSVEIHDRQSRPPRQLVCASVVFPAPARAEDHDPLHARGATARR